MTRLDDQTSERFEPRSNRPFSIHLPGRVWLVHSGNLDLFLVDVADGEPAGARYPLLRVGAGCAVFGMCIPAVGPIVVAVPTPGTELSLLSKDHLRTSVAGSAAGLALLDDWILRLAGSAAATAPPRHYAQLEPGQIHDATKDSKPVLPASGVLWIKHLRGSSHFASRSEIYPMNNSGYFPVCKYGWVQPRPDSQIMPLTSEDWDKSDPQWRGLQDFHIIALQCFALNRRQLEEAERRRRLSQVAADARILGS